MTQDEERSLGEWGALLKKEWAERALCVAEQLSKEHAAIQASDRNSGTGAA